MIYTRLDVDFGRKENHGSIQRVSTVPSGADLRSGPQQSTNDE